MWILVNEIYIWLVVTGTWMEYDFPETVGNVMSSQTDELSYFSEGLVETLKPPTLKPPARKIWRCRQNEWANVWIWPGRILRNSDQAATMKIQPSRPFSRSETTRFKWWFLAPTNISGNKNYGTQLGDGFGNCWHEMFSCSTNRQVASVRFRRNKIKVPHARGCNFGNWGPNITLRVNPHGHTWPIVKCVNGEKHWFNIAERQNPGLM